MKQFIVLVAGAFLMLSSFTTALPAHKVKIPAGASFSAQGSITFTDVYGEVCNGDRIYFPSVIITYNYHGAENKNMYMIKGADQWHATGTSIYTNETWTADFETKYHDKIPFTNGALVIRSKANNSFISESGFEDSFTFSLHLTFNANGTLVAEKSSVEIVCG